MHSVLIRGGTIVDGTGRAGYQADLAVHNGVITDIGNLKGDSADEILSADGLVVAPGFFDAHAHSDTAFVRDSSGASKLYHGITTEISGNCGDSPFPCAEGSEDREAWLCPSMDAMLRRFETEGWSMAVNQAMLVGHGTLRQAVMGDSGRTAEDEEIHRMQLLLDREMRSGAWGLSLGLEYAPGCFADQRELNALGSIVRKYHGLMPCHMRSEGLRIEEAVRELLEAGRASGAHVHVSHLKLDNYRVHGRADMVWSMLEQARAEGIEVTADMYPYTASCTTLSIRGPRWAMDGGTEGLLQVLQGPRRGEVVAGIREHYFNAERAETCLFCDDRGTWPELVGRTLRDVAENMLHTTDYAEAAADILLRTRAQVWCIFFVMSEQDMLTFLRHDVGIGSDGWALPGDPARVGSRPHPRSYGAVAEFFRLAREQHICSLEEAVRRVTSKAAAVMGMTDRGTLAPGKTADITVFDPRTIAPRATYLDPVQLAEGVEHVLIRGGIALLNGCQTEYRGGQFLRKTGA